MLAGVGLAALIVPTCLTVNAFGAGGWPGERHHKNDTQSSNQNQAKVQSSLPPAFSIPVDPLGFNAPSNFYLGLRERLISLDFLDEDHLLFTFRTPGLIRRTDPNEYDERQVRAMVLKLPEGTVEAEALWTLHGHDRYLWTLNNGKFLLRDQNNVEQGDASLELKPLLHFPGPLLWMEMDPDETYLVTDSYEPDTQAGHTGDVSSPSTASANVSEDGTESSGKPDVVIRILRRSSGQVMLASHVRRTVHLPINSDGYLELLRSAGREWTLNLSYFTGGSKLIGKVDSDCSPPLEFISHDEVIANTCSQQGGRELVALTTDGRVLWKLDSNLTQVWPLIVIAPNGSRFAVETLTVSHAVGAFSPLSTGDIKSQLVQVFDAAGAAQELRTVADPVLDAGGNVAFSPSGSRVAVLDAGAIQVFQLPALPAAAAPQSH